MNWILLFLLLVATITLAAPTSPIGRTTDDSLMVPQSDSPTITQNASPTILQDNSLTLLTDVSLTVATKPTNKSPTVPRDLLSYLPVDPLFEIYSTLPDKAKAGLKLASGKKLKEAVDLFEPFDLMLESSFLENLIGLNQESQLDEQIIDILVRDHHVQEIVARQTVEEARERIYRSLHELLCEELSWILHPMTISEIYREALRNIGIVQENWSIEPQVYNDDRIMDLVFPVMLIGKKSEQGFLSVDPILFGEVKFRVIAGVKRNQPHWRDLPASEFQNMVDQMMQLEGSVNYNAYKVWKILQQARQMIKQANKTQPNRNVDKMMIELLVPLLHATTVEAVIAADEDEIRATMEQARNAVTLRNAVVFNKAHVLRNLVASSNSVPVFVFGEIARQDIFYILRQHPSFEAGRIRLLERIVNHQGRLPVLNLLLKDPSTTHITLVEALLEAKTISMQAFIFKEIFEHADRAAILKILSQHTFPRAKILTELYAKVLSDDSCNSHWVWRDLRDSCKDSSVWMNLRNLRYDHPSVSKFNYALSKQSGMLSHD